MDDLSQNQQSSEKQTNETSEASILRSAKEIVKREVEAMTKLQNMDFGIVIEEKHRISPTDYKNALETIRIFSPIVVEQNKASQ